LSSDHDFEGEHDDSLSERIVRLNQAQLRFLVMAVAGRNVADTRTTLTPAVMELAVTLQMRAAA
jgi:hypothetical protein